MGESKSGELGHFSIRARDAFDNDCRVGGERFEVVLRAARAGPAGVGPAGGESGQGEARGGPLVRDEAGGVAVDGTVLDTGDGAYSVSYRVKQADSYVLSVTLGGAHISGSPFALRVSPGPTCAPRCSASGAAVHTAVAGAESIVRIVAADCYGNAQTAGGDAWALTLTRPGVPNVYGAVADIGDGTYNATYRATVRGPWALHIKSGGVHLAGSPFRLLVQPAITDAASSIAVGGGVSTAYTGEPAVFMLRTRDRFGNERGVGGDQVSATLTQAASRQVVTANVTDTGDGSYTLRYLLSVTSGEDYAMHVTVNGGDIAGSPFAVSVVAGPMNCAQSRSVELPPCVAGAVSEAPIFAKDRQGNQRTSGGDTFVASLELDDADGLRSNETVQVGDVCSIVWCRSQV